VNAKFFQQLLLVLALLSRIVTSSHAQVAFRNLNFEQANLPAIPAGQYGGFVPANQAFPGWTVTDGFEGLNVFQNNISGGEATADILGPDWQGEGALQIISGNYTAVLQSGEVTRGIVSAMLEQTGTIPITAKSITFDALGSVTAGALAVSFGGQNLTFVPLAAGPNGSELYGADVSSYANQTGLLIFSDNPVGNVNFTATVLDNISFSPNLIPEPQTWSLLLCGAGAIALRRRGIKV
jgi:hypothetical protein